MFILVTLFMPKGMVGLPAQLAWLKRRYLTAKTARPEAAPVAAETSPGLPKGEGLAESNNP
jgi:hypothetical protein